VLIKISRYIDNKKIINIHAVRARQKHPASSLLRCYRHSLLLDTGALTAALTLKIQLGAAYAANLVQLHRFDIWGEQGECPFHTYTVRDLPHSEGGCLAFALTFDHLTLEALYTLLVTFDDLVVHRDVVTGLEVRKLSFSRQLFVYKSYSSVHKTKICDAGCVLLKDGKGSEISRKVQIYLATFTARFSRMTVTLI